MALSPGGKDRGKRVFHKQMVLAQTNKRISFLFRIMRLRVKKNVLTIGLIVWEATSNEKNEKAGAFG
jgi:hypothetical protein